MKNLINVGSYIASEPIEMNGDLWKGKIILNSRFKEFQKGDIVYYKDEDSTQFNFKKRNIHLILHYLIPFVEIKKQ